MPRRIFISYEGEDRNRAKGFNLLRWNKNVDIEFVGRHLLDPVHSKDPEYIERKIKELQSGSSVIVVLIGQHTAESSWVEREVRWALEKDSPCGVLGIRLDSDAPIPSILNDCGAEIIDWKPSKFADAIERAAIQAGPIRALARVGSAGGHGCTR